MKDEYIKKFYNEVNQELDGDYKIILEPPRNLKEEWIIYLKGSNKKKIENIKNDKIKKLDKLLDDYINNK